MKSIFTDSFPFIETEKELQALIKKYPQYDSYYVASGAMQERREWFDALYGQYKPYADRNFLSDLKKHFHQRTWEMYLGCVLLDSGIQMSNRPNDARPDISFRYKGKTCWVECTACEKGSGTDQVPTMLYNVVQAVPVDNILLRISTALQEKHKKYIQYLKKGLIKEDDPFVIAISVGALGWLESYIPLILRCLFAVGHPTITFPINGGPEKHSISTIPFIKKKNESTVPMNFFLKKENSGISAVIYDKKLVINHSDTTGKDMLIVHNPMAKNPLSKDILNTLKCYKVDERGGITL